MSLQRAHDPGPTDLFADRATQNVDGSRTLAQYSESVGTWHDPGLGRPIAAPLDRCAELLGVDLATLGEAAAKVEPYIRADGARIWSLMQLERQLRPEAYRRRRGGYLDRRRIPAADL